MNHTATSVVFLCFMIPGPILCGVCVGYLLARVGALRNELVNYMRKAGKEETTLKF